MIRAELYAPKSYWAASPDEVSRVAGGCGPGGFGDFLVPDKIWGLDVSHACRIHDWMYHLGETLADKDEADRVFLNNMLRLVEAAGGPGWLQRLRANRAHTYHLAVATFGGPFFWKDKNEPGTMAMVAV